MEQQVPQETLAHLAHFSHKPGVTDAFVLCRKTGAIVVDLKNSQSRSAGDNDTEDGAAAGMQETAMTRTQLIARTVCDIVKLGDKLSESLDANDDNTKMMRMRFDKNELVVVPKPQYILVVMHGRMA